MMSKNTLHLTNITSCFSRHAPRAAEARAVSLLCFIQHGRVYPPIVDHPLLFSRPVLFAKRSTVPKTNNPKGIVTKPITTNGQT